MVQQDYTPADVNPKAPDVHFSPSCPTCSRFLALVKRPPHLHSTASLFYLLFYFINLCPDLQKEVVANQLVLGSLNFHFKLVTRSSAGMRYPMVSNNSPYIWEQQTEAYSNQMVLDIHPGQ